MKTTFKSDEIAHAWANASAPYGKSPGAMSFNGEVFLSYNTAIGRRITHKGKVAYIRNVQSFSPSTSKHQRIMWRAIPSGVPVFKYEDTYGTRLDVTGAQLFEYAVQRSAEAQQQAEKARARKDFLLGQSGAWLEEARKVSEFFGLRKKVDSKAIERMAAAKARAEKAEAKARKLRQERAIKEAAEKMQQWLAGEDVSTYGLYDLPARFRIEGEELVSSKGARVPIADAERALRFALARREKGWRENGETCPVGGYRLNSITPEGVIAGCHRITWEEVERVSAMLQTVTA